MHAEAVSAVAEQLHVSSEDMGAARLGGITSCCPPSPVAQ